MTKKIVQALALMLSISACNSPEKKTESEPPLVVAKDSNEYLPLIKVNAEDFEKAIGNYKDKILYDTLSFKKQNGTIKLPVEESKDFVIFTDTLLDTDETEMRLNSYLGQLPDLHQYIVTRSLYEGYNCYLVDQKTGTKTTLWDNPKISPEGNLIANISLPYGMEGIPNGLQIWKLDEHSGSIVKHLEMDQEIWAPYDFVWETNTSLILKVIPVETLMHMNGDPGPNDYHYLKLDLK